MRIGSRRPPRCKHQRCTVLRRLMLAVHPRNRRILPNPVRIAIPRDLLIVAQPFCFAFATLIARFDAIPSAPTALLRPLVVVLAVTAIVLLLALLVTRNAPLAAVLSSAFVLISMRELVLGGVLTAVAVWWVLLKILQIA